MTTVRQRSESIQEAARTSYDVCVIGGGATGAGCALDSQLRGYKTILVEAGDFGSGTSSASTKLIHGGLRYLEQAVRELDFRQYRVVRRALQERRLMMLNAPYLVRVCKFVVPCRSFAEAAYYNAGLKLYDWLSGDARLSSSHFFGRAESFARMPCLNIKNLFGIVVYSDGQFDDARYNLALAHSCSTASGTVLNYVRAMGFEKNEHGQLVAAILEDRQSKERLRVQAQAFVNATGPFSDNVRRLASADAETRLRVSKGVHILLPLPTSFGNEALLIPKTEDERVIFAIPWLGRLLVGTTETESPVDAEMTVTKEEAEFLLRHVNRCLAKPFDLTDIVSATAGLRPLVKSRDSRDTKKMIRDYEIEIESSSGLISVLGGKWTVYRAMAEDAIDAVQTKLTGQITASRTRRYLLYGAEGENSSEGKTADEYPVSNDTTRHLVQKFGSVRARVLDLAREDESLLAPIVEGAPHIQAEVIYSVREEMALHIEDILNRRLGLQLSDWRLAVQAASVVGRLLERELRWSQAQRQEEIGRYIAQINRSIQALGQKPIAL